MSAESQLRSVEDSLKEKHLDAIRRMCYTDLKEFTKGKFKQCVSDEMIALLPGHSVSRITETAQCIANAVSREVKSLLTKKQQQPQKDTSSTVTNLLSDTFVHDLDSTLQADDELSKEQVHEQEHITVDDCDDDLCDINDSQPPTSQTSSTASKTGEPLNDSITKLKEAVHVENQQTAMNSESKDECKFSKNDTKCCESCKVKPKSKKKYDMIQCSACMVWHHEICVGLSKDDLVGLWFCPVCRTVPSNLTVGMKSLKRDVELLKQTTLSILSAVQGLSAKLESSIENINDKLTAIQRQINGKDMCITEKLEILSKTADNIKVAYDQKSCQILNKTTAVFEKVKAQSDTIKALSEKPTPVQKPEITKRATINKSDITKNNKPELSKLTKPYHKQSIPQNKSNHNQTKKRTPSESKQKRFNKPNAPHQINGTHEVVDLTGKPKKCIRETTLLAGSSIFKGVKNSDLNNDTTVRSFPGATIQTLKSKLEQYDIEQCKTIFLHVGGNDGDNGADMDSFQDDYIDLLESLASDDRRLIVSGILPRGTKDLEPYNQQLKSLCDANNIDFIDNYDNFLLASGELPDTYYHRDKTHLNVAGTRKLLKAFDKFCKVTGPFKSSDIRPQRQQRSNMPPPDRRYHSQKYCHICKIKNHHTQECWFNGQNTGSMGRAAY